MKTTLRTYYYKTMLHILPYVTIWFNPTEKGLSLGWLCFELEIRLRKQN